MPAPTITGTVSGQTTTSQAPMDPFSGVTIGDTNAGATDTLSITLSGPGSLSGTGLSFSSGTYTLTGTAATITSELQALSFTPVDNVANASVTTTFTLSDTSSAYGANTYGSQLSTLAIFTGPNGAHPSNDLVSDAAGDLFGVTFEGGANNDGTVFEIAKSTGVLSTVVTFTGANGAQPFAVSIDAAGDLFGTTYLGGAHGDGTVYEIAKSTGQLTTLVSFSGANGAGPLGGLISDAVGDLFGTTYFGGAHGDGTVYEIAKSTGQLTTLASFSGANGQNPEGSLTIDADGNLFGITSYGGMGGDGTVYEIAKSTGQLTTLASFSGANGNSPERGLTIDAAGDLFGTTFIGGAYNKGTVFEIVKSTGALITLATFTGANGANPLSDLILDAAGDLFGTTEVGGAYNGGTVFEIVKSTGLLSTLATATDAGGEELDSGLTINPAGDLFGTTSFGVGNADGTVFELPAAFVATPVIDDTTTVTEIATVGPVMVTAGASVSYVAGAAPVALDAGLTVADAAAVSLSAATVSISAGFAQGDMLSVGSPQTGIVSQYNAATGVLTLSGSASLAAYKTELDSITFASASATATASSRTITWSVNDGVTASAPVTSHVSVSRLPPAVTAGASVSYVAGASPVALDAGLTVADAAAVSLSAATVSISAGFAQGDMLSVGSPQTGIASQYNAATGVLTLSGSASLAAYKTELDSITFASATATASSRTITWSVNDGVTASAPVTSHVSVSRLPPAVTAGASVSYVAGASPVALDAGLTVADAAAVSLSAATVSISAGFAQGDMLSVGSSQTGIASQYNAATGVLTLSGSASLAAYKTELDSITFASATATASSRTITWSVNDGVTASAPVTSHVSVSRLPPAVTAGASVSYVAGASPVALDAGLTVADAAAVSLLSATVSISAGFAQGDMLSVGSSQTGIASQYNAATGVLTLSGSASLAAYKTELDSITFASATATASSRTITWSVNDGVTASAPVTSHVSVSRLPPAVTAGASVSYVAGASPVALDAGLTVADAAAVSLLSATVSISAGFAQGDMLSVGSSQTGIASQYNAATGVLTLSGSASLAAYKTELDSITFASATATASSRTITWSVNDGVTASAPVTSHVSVSRLPPAVTAGASVSYVAGASPVALDAGLTVADAAAVSLLSATVSISAGFAQGDMLSVGSSQTGIASQYNAATGVLTLSGSASLAAYKTELDSITFASATATASSRTITWSVNDGVTASAPVTSHVSVSSAPPDPSVPTPDLDILWQNANGQAAIWEMDGTNVIASAKVGANPGPSWKLVGTGDFNGDGNPDLLWQNANGQAAVWEMDGTKVIDSAKVGANPGPSWELIGTGDFNGDGNSDLLWQNASGQAAVWEMNGTNVIATAKVGANPGPSWKLVGTGDFNGDGKSDLLWQNANGQAAIWEMDGTNVIASAKVGANPGPSWKLIGTGDFNGDGFSDILWQNTSGQAAIWEIDGTNVIASAKVGANPGPSWKLIGTGDFNGDGFSDILWQNTSGQAAIWEIDGTNVIGTAKVGANPGTSWHTIGLT